MSFADLGLSDELLQAVEAAGYTEPTPIQAQAIPQVHMMKDLIAIANIAGVEPAPEQNRLLLFMRDRRILSAALERACNARDYYSGFYIERSEDGQLCARRDLLQSRAGASCKVAQLNRLIAVRD